MSFGISTSLGTHQNELGLFVRFDYAQKRISNRTQFNIKYHLKNLGPKLHYLESRLSNGIHFQFGEQRNAVDEMVLTYGYFTKENAVGYELAFLFNKIGTRQSIGAISTNLKNLNIQIQNDLLGNLKGRDRFRTGALSIGYSMGQTNFQLKSLLWTGETRCAGKFVEKDSNYPSRYGYKDVSACPFSDCSHGVLAFQMSHQTSIANELSVSIGGDSERVRHWLQNRLIHDMCLVPESLVKSENPHVPMLDSTGQAYLFREDQALRKDLFYFQLGYNSLLLY